MTSSPTSHESPLATEPAPRKRRRFLKWSFVFLLLIGMGSATAFHLLRGETGNASIPNYEKPDETQAVAQEQKARARVQTDKEALAAARQAVKTAEADWQTAQENLKQSRQNQKSAPAQEKSDADEDFQAAEQEFAQATKKLETAKAQLKTAEDKLKTADQKLAEAEAERERVAKLAALQENYRKALLGHWRTTEDYGPTQLELRDDGTASMFIQFEGKARYIVGDHLDIDIEWEVVGDHVIFNSVRGRPESMFKFVTGLKGTRRDYMITHMDENAFVTQQADDKAKIKKWTRVEKAEVKVTKE